MSNIDSPEYFASEAQPAIDASFVLVARFDEALKDSTLKPVEITPSGDKVYEYVVPDGAAPLYIEGAGGGGGGGGGASGRGPGHTRGGGGAGGNGCDSQGMFSVSVNPGDTLRIVLGHPGLRGAGAIGTDQFGSNGGRGGDTIVTQNMAVLFNFPGANGGLGGQFQRDGEQWKGGDPGNAWPPESPSAYNYTLGGRGARDNPIYAESGRRPSTPVGGIGGQPGANGGGGGGGSIKGNGGAGGGYQIVTAGQYGQGQNGAFAAGGGGGAGGGPGTSDNGGLGGNGGLGYVWLYKRKS